MTAHNLKKYLCSPDNLAERMEQIYQEARNLKEDIEFFSVYAKRNKESSFQLNILPSKGMCRQFFYDVYRKNYSFNLQDLASMLIEYEVLNDLMKSIQVKEIHLKQDIEKIIDIYRYFQNNYDIDIRNYAADFIGCSMGTQMARDRISEIINHLKQEESMEADEMLSSSMTM